MGTHNPIYVCADFQNINPISSALQNIIDGQAVMIHMDRMLSWMQGFGTEISVVR